MTGLRQRAISARPHLARAITLACAVLLQPAAASAGDDWAGLFDLCSKGSSSFKARAAAISQAGYTPIAVEGPMWVQGQVTHIAMSTLKQGGQDTRKSYEDYRKSAADGELFRSDIQQASFTDAGKRTVINLSFVDGEPGCSFAFAPGAFPQALPLRTKKAWKSNIGTFTEYRLGGGRYASSSQLGPVWKNWIKGRQRVSGFLVVSQ